MIYFIREAGGGNIKIGHAKDPWRRRAFLQTAHVSELTLEALEEGGVEREAALHAMFAAYHVRGEWFAPAAGLLAYIDRLGKAQRPPSKKTDSRVFWGGKTDAEVARLVGVPDAYLSTIRNRKRRPSPEVALRLQRATGVSAVDLIFGEHYAEAAAGCTVAQRRAA